MSNVDMIFRTRQVYMELKKTEICKAIVEMSNVVRVKTLNEARDVSTFLNGVAFDEKLYKKENDILRFYKKTLEKDFTSLIKEEHLENYMGLVELLLSCGVNINILHILDRTKTDKGIELFMDLLIKMDCTELNVTDKIRYFLNIKSEKDLIKTPDNLEDLERKDKLVEKIFNKTRR